MNLIIFDIDGTLTQTNKVDSQCFAQAIKDILKISDINTNWSSYQYSTDSGLLKEIYQHFLQREPTVDEEKIIQQHFVNYLKQEWINDKTRYAVVPGADTIFNEISYIGNWHIGIATGGWQQSALFKLEAAAIAHTTLPKAYADDHIERTQIINKVIHQAKKLYRTTHYDRIIYVGDRTWDEQAAKALDIDFIGVGDGFVNRKPEIFAIQDFSDSVPILNYLAMI